MELVEHLKWVRYIVYMEILDFFIFTIEGWNSWNHFGCGVSESLVRQTADAMVASGLAAAGYQYGLFFS